MNRWYSFKVNEYRSFYTKTGEIYSKQEIQRKKNYTLCLKKVSVWEDKIKTFFTAIKLVDISTNEKCGMFL